MARLDHICKLNMGQSPDSSSYNEERFGLPFFQGNADFGQVHPTARVWCSKPTKEAKPGDILISVRAPIGALNIADVDCCIGRGLAALTVNEKICSKGYLWHALRGKVKELNQKGTGSTFKAISKNTLAETEIRLPSLDEQMHIAVVLDKVDDLISLRKQQLAKLDELVKARFVELFGDPVANPFGWRKLTVQQAIDEKIIDKPLDGNHGGKHPKTSDYVPSGIPFIMANNLVEGKVDLENCAFISRKQADSLDKGFAKDGDVLITHKGTIGRTAILHCSYPYIMLTPQVTYYRPKTGIIPEYLKAYFDTDYFQGIIGNIASVGSTRAYIGITAQQELPLIVPPMELQKQFAAFVEQTDKSKLAIQQSLDKLETLKKALMQKYFG